MNGPFPAPEGYEWKYYDRSQPSIGLARRPTQLEVDDLFRQLRRRMWHLVEMLVGVTALVAGWTVIAVVGTLLPTAWIALGILTPLGVVSLVVALKWYATRARFLALLDLAAKGIIPMPRAVQ